MTVWKVNCMENEYPGMWQRWFLNQCVAVGWKGSWGYKLRGETDGGIGWRRVRKALERISVGDKVIVQLRGHRLGRVGEVTGKAIEDEDWDPLVPKTEEDSDGEMGRRIFVRWDLTVGPDDRDMVVKIPESMHLNRWEIRTTVCELRSRSWDEIVEIMNNPANWVGLLTTKFSSERALSDYIAAYPYRLEDRLLTHPSQKVRERVFDDKTRADVLLIDRSDQAVIVECKQHSPTTEHVKQLRHYLERYKCESKQPVRGILIHGGARKLDSDVQQEAAKNPPIELVQYRLDVEFSACH